MDSQAQITQRDIATLLYQGNVALARAKAQKLIREDVKSDLLQTLEMHIGVILGHLNELERRCASVRFIVVRVLQPMPDVNPLVERQAPSYWKPLQALFMPDRTLIPKVCIHVVHEMLN